MSALDPISTLDQNRAIRDAEEFLRHPGATVSVVGKKPWYQRALSSMRGPAAVLFCYAAAFATFSLGSTQDPAPKSAGVSPIELVNQQAFVMSPAKLKPLFSFQKEIQGVPEAAAFDVPENMAPQQVAQKLLDLGKPFQALAVTLEGLETKPYRDGCGLNVGMGYCIDARVREYGPGRVRQDLLGAGLTDSQTDTLLGNDRKAQNGVELTRTQALALLSLTEGDYRTRARDLLGQRVFDALPDNRKAVMTWLSYNTGEGLGRFNRLLTAVRQDRTSDAVQHMTPFFRQGGQMVPNARAGSWLMAAYWSEDAMKSALARPDALESGARNGRSPLEVVAPREAGQLALRGTLPESPYVAHGLTELKSLNTRDVQVAQVDNLTVTLPTPSDWRSQRQVSTTQPAPAEPTQPETSQPNIGSDLGLNPQDLLDNLPQTNTSRRPAMRH